MTEQVKLEYPITCEGIDVDTINLRRPKARDLKKLEKTKSGEVAQSIDLIADLAEMPPSAIEELDAADFQKIGDKVAGFLEQ